jgi:hypothetical protein
MPPPQLTPDWNYVCSLRFLPARVLKGAQSWSSTLHTISSSGFGLGLTLDQPTPAPYFIHPSLRSKSMRKQAENVVIDVQ